MSLGILYEYPDTDEEGIKITAQDMGIDLKQIPFRKVSVLIGKGVSSLRSIGADYSSVLKDVTVVLNRTQSKNRRLYAASVLEAFGKHVVNSQRVEFACFSKFRTLLDFWKHGVPIPTSVFVPCDSHDQASTTRIHNEEAIADLMRRDLGFKEVVLKPDAGTHGKEVRLARDRTTLIKMIDETEPSIINPIGFVGQEFVDKWFYDLRIVVAKERGKPAYCYPQALSRGGFTDFRTNTFLGNMVFGAELPSRIKELSIKAGEAIGNETEAWVLALDAMLDIGKDHAGESEHVKSEIDKLNVPFEKVRQVKRDNDAKRKNFRTWNGRLEEAYGAYKSTDAYENVKNIIEESIKSGQEQVLFHEANSSPEFWEQTRIIAGINIAVPLLNCAKSIHGAVS